MDPGDRRYTKEHEWVKLDGDLAVIGITEFAQDQLGDIVYVELPEVGSKIQQFKAFGVVESVKTASDLYAPVSGEVVEVNQRLADEPGRVNHSPYDEGWMIKVRLADAAEMDPLMTAQQYADEIAN